VDDRENQLAPSGGVRLREYIIQHDIDAEIVRPGVGTPTVSAAAEALGVQTDQIIKSLLFQGRDGETVVAIVRGTAKVDRRKLSRATGIRKPRLASPQTVLELTGYEAGGTPPIGYRHELAVVMDDGVFDKSVVFGGGGEIDVMLRISPETIRRIVGASVDDICEDE
jgi:Cys-tRNA(Pro) deacylase